ncbi:citrate synthase [Ceratobasidium sp. AG-Ba]|nr:citrate synthase [Ceratobasidium sp. AG-Ba]
MIFSRVVTGFLVATLGAVAQSSNATTADKPFALASPEQPVQCKNATIVWQGGKAPFRINIKPACGGGQASPGQDLVVSTSGATSYELPVKYPAGTQLTVSISDATNMQASAPPTTVISGDEDDSCTVQTACPNNLQAPGVPVALASGSSGAVVPTDHLVTADPSGAPTSTGTPASTSSVSMVILYSYVSAPTPTKSPSSTTPESNAALACASTSLFAVLGAAVAIGSHLVLG